MVLALKGSSGFLTLMTTLGVVRVVHRGGSILLLLDLSRDFSAEGVFTLPVYFSSDWLNEYWDSLDVDDYRFIYMGPTGTW